MLLVLHKIRGYYDIREPLEWHGTTTATRVIFSPWWPRDQGSFHARAAGAAPESRQIAAVQNVGDKNNGGAHKWPIVLEIIIEIQISYFPYYWLNFNV